MSLVPVYYLNQDVSWQEPAFKHTRAVCRDLKGKGLGQFITNGRAFQLFERTPVSSPVRRYIEQPDAKDHGRDGHGQESLHPGDKLPFHGVGVMSRAVDFGKTKASPFAKAIIDAWAFRFQVRPVDGKQLEALPSFVQ